jgi:glutamate-ammonia-ligase adenylyltransferase
VRTALERWAEARPDVLDELAAEPELASAVVAIAAASRPLAQLLVQDAGAIEVLRARGRPVEAPSLTGAGSFDDVVTWQRRELLRIAADDLTGAAPLEQTMHDLTSMAELVLRAAHARADEVLGPSTRLSVVAMGKLGAGELNYASDIDLLFVGAGDAAELDRAGRLVLDLAGRCFRVDLDLRPEGRDGPLVRSLGAYDAYWARWAQPWERQALLKSRPVAGDAELGARWAEAAGAVVWDRPFGADELRHLRENKARVEDEVHKQGVADREVKRAPGGIRDIEFSAQLLQLVHGRADELLRAPATLAVLDALAQGGYVDGEDAAALADSYRFLRRVEHALQLEDLRQTHTVPADRDQRRRIARVIGFAGTPDAGPTEHFDRALAQHRSRVRSVHERVWFRPLLDSFSGSGPLSPTAAAQRLAAAGFTDLERTRQAVAELTRGLTRSSRMMQQLLPLLLDWLSASPDPDLGLLGLRRLASGEQRSRALATAFRESPEAARLLASIVGTSRQLGDVLVANPDLIERLPDAERLRTRSLPELLTSAGNAIGWRVDRDDQQRALQRWHQRHVFGVGARDVLGHAGVEVVGADLTALAEAGLRAALAALAPQVPFAVDAFGRFGGR